jgi:hypothetical protein
MALPTNSNVRAELSDCKDVREFLEFLIITWMLASDYCNVCTALMIYLTLSISVASNERSFSTTKQIKNYPQNYMTSKRLRSLAVLSTENSDSQKILSNLNAVINKFASLKSRRVI